MGRGWWKGTRLKTLGGRAVKASERGGKGRRVEELEEVDFGREGKGKEKEKAWEGRKRTSPV